MSSNVESSSVLFYDHSPALSPQCRLIPLRIRFRVLPAATRVLPATALNFRPFPTPDPPAVTSVLTHRQHPHTSEPLCLLFCLPGMFFRRYLFCFSPSYGLCTSHLRETCLTTLPKVESPTLILYLLLLCYCPLSDFLVLDITINIYSWPSVSWGFCIHGVGWIHGCGTTGMEGRLTVTFSVRNLSICRFWYLWRS